MHLLTRLYGMESTANTTSQHIFPTCPSLRVAPLIATPLCCTTVTGTSLPGGGSCLLSSLLLLAPEPPSLPPDAFLVSFFRAWRGGERERESEREREC